jgi:hypothetical protein
MSNETPFVIHVVEKGGAPVTAMRGMAMSESVEHSQELPHAQGSAVIERGVLDAATFVVNQPTSHNLHARIANRQRVLRVVVLHADTHMPVAGGIVHLRTVEDSPRLVVSKITDGLGTADFILPWPDEPAAVTIDLATPWQERRTVAFDAAQQYQVVVLQLAVE